MRNDVASLSEFDQQMNDRLQFLLDAVLGFINNDQNDIMKVLTVITVVTIPPMILAGIWGMNFKSIRIRLAARLRVRPDHDRA